ncbi:MAG: hypothetical protein R3C11_18420 [Planctomycetaceae bacterium]
MSLFSYSNYRRTIPTLVLGLIASASFINVQDIYAEGEQPVALQAPQNPESTTSDTTSAVSVDPQESVTSAPSELSEKSATETTVTAEKIPVEPQKPAQAEKPSQDPPGEFNEEEKPVKIDAEPAEPQKVVHSDPLLNKVEEAIDLSRRRFLTSNIHTPWQIMHGILAFREKYELNKDDKSTDKINGIEFISNDPTFHGEHWFLKTPYGGKAHPFTVPYAFEGHPNQFPAIMTMTDLPLKHTFKTAEGEITMEDIVKNAQMEINSNEGLTWTLWFLTHYLPSDTEWKNARGENWSIERLVQTQNRVIVEKQPVVGVTTSSP